MNSARHPQGKCSLSDIRRAMRPLYPKSGEFATSDAALLQILRTLRRSGKGLSAETVELEGCRERRLPCGDRAAFNRLSDGAKRVVLAAGDVRGLVAALDARGVRPGLARTRRTKQAKVIEQQAAKMADLVAGLPLDDELRRSAESTLAVARRRRQNAEFAEEFDKTTALHRTCSALEAFIGGDLLRCYERITGEKGSFARPTSGGEPSGALIEFAIAFFQQVGLDVQRETVARATTRQRSARPPQRGATRGTKREPSSKL